MDPWLDSLSEDWVSQRGSGSSSPTFSGRTVSEPNSISTAKTSNHSRGFRTTSRAKSTSTQHQFKTHQPWSEKQGSIRKGSGILAERDLNDVAAGPRPGYKTSISTRLDIAAVETRGRRASSTLHSIGSYSTRRHQTVHQKSVSASPQKDRRALLTPEWRRRLLGRNPSCRDMCDLFSPIGLEKMFRPPPVSQGHDPISTRHLNLDQIMSPDTPDSPNRRGMAKEMHSPERSKQASPRGADGNEHDECVDTSLIPALPTKDGPPSKELSGHVPTNETEKGDELRQQEIGPSGDRRMHDSNHLPQSTGDRSADHFHSESGDRTNGTASGREDERNEDLTPILISRHNTADGGIDYVPSDLAQHHQEKPEGESKQLDETDSNFGSEDCPGPHWLKAGQMTLGSIEMGSTQSYDLPSSPHFGKIGTFPGLRAKHPSIHPQAPLQNALLSPSSVEMTGSAYETLDPEAHSESTPPISTVGHQPNKPENLVPAVTHPAVSIKAPPASAKEEAQGIVQPKSPGCALKLFDNHDTFTNDRLLQRMQTLNEAAEDVEAEIQAHEGRVPQALSPRRRDRQRERDVTIMFSSPVVSQNFQFPTRNPVANGARFSREVSVLDPENSLAEVIRELNARPLPHNASSRRTSFGLPIRSSSLAAPRHVSFGRTSYSSHRISPINEHDTSSARVTRRARFGMAISTPFHRRESAPNTRGHTNRGSSVVTFHLSPLADFTVNQSEETLPLEVSYLTTRKGSYSRKERSYAFSLATKELVQKLTEKEPYEPYWDYIWRLDLSGERLKTLHGLSDYCPRIEELNVSNNQIGHLKGVPSSIRQLQISHNCLSSLTSWGHLHNLQYLDVSNNELDSLRGFRGLLHLRELKADNNRISSLEGILELNGLIKLDISRNALEKLDFTRANLLVYLSFCEVGKG